MYRVAFPHRNSRSLSTTATPQLTLRLLRLRPDDPHLHFRSEDPENTHWYEQTRIIPTESTHQQPTSIAVPTAVPITARFPFVFTLLD